MKKEVSIAPGGARASLGPREVPCHADRSLAVAFYVPAQEEGLEE